MESRRNEEMYWKEDPIRRVKVAVRIGNQKSVAIREVNLRAWESKITTRKGCKRSTVINKQTNNSCICDNNSKTPTANQSKNHLGYKPKVIRN